MKTVSRGQRQKHNKRERQREAARSLQFFYDARQNIGRRDGPITFPVVLTYFKLFK